MCKILRESFIYSNSIPGIPQVEPGIIDCYKMLIFFGQWTTSYYKLVEENNSTDVSFQHLNVIPKFGWDIVMFDLDKNHTQ